MQSELFPSVRDPTAALVLSFGVALAMLGAVVLIASGAVLLALYGGWLTPSITGLSAPVMVSAWRFAFVAGVVMLATGIALSLLAEFRDWIGGRPL